VGIKVPNLRHTNIFTAVISTNTFDGWLDQQT